MRNAEKLYSNPFDKKGTAWSKHVYFSMADTFYSCDICVEKYGSRYSVDDSTKNS